MTTSSPVAFFVFNRPECTRRVFDEIARARPQKLLLVADGPRDDHPTDAKKVAATREIIEAIDWPCEVHRNFSDENLGCKRRMVSGIGWVFDTVEEAVILEDDCLPDATFFSFCDKLLPRYREDRRVMAVGGSNFQQGRRRSQHGYYFSRHTSIWGWASWRRAWQHFDLEMKTWPEFRDMGGMQAVTDTPREASMWTGAFNIQYEGKLDAWDYSWTFACWSQSGLTVTPDVNLISNIGFGPGAVHTLDPNHFLSDLPRGQLTEVGTAPFVVRHAEADRFTSDFITGSGLQRSLKRLRERIGGYLRRRSS